MENINWAAVGTATIMGYVLGALWYSPILFGKVWMKVANIDQDQISKSNKGLTYGVSFIFIAIASFNLAYFVADPKIGAMMGATYGFLTGFGWVMMGIGVTALFELKSWSYIFINGGYWVVNLTVMGLILGSWK